MAAMHSFERKLARAWPPHRWRDVTILAAVSGGADSVAMLRALAAIWGSAGDVPEAGRLCAAHLNHRLRAADSDADEQFVVDLCRGLQIPCEVGVAAVIGGPMGSGASLELAARKARYRFLEQAACRRGARYVTVAHTADDQAETILHRILRGTGIRGLSGMARARPLGPATLLRPMLRFRRCEVLRYLEDIGQPFRTDASNADQRFTRNRLRHDLLPQLAGQYNPNVVDAILRLGHLAGECRQWMDQSLEPLHAACCPRDAGPEHCVRIDTRPLQPEPTVVVREVLMGLWRRHGWPMQAMGFEQWNALAEMARASGKPASPRAKQTLPGGVRAEGGPEGLVLWPPLPQK